MIRIESSIEISGKKFKPSLLSPEITSLFYSYHNFGEIGKKGRYKNQPIPFGSAVVKAPDNIEEWLKVKWLIRNIKDKLKLIREAGGNDISLRVAIYHDGQCNGEISTNSINDLASLGIPIMFSVYEDSVPS